MSELTPSQTNLIAAMRQALTVGWEQTGPNKVRWTSSPKPNAHHKFWWSGGEYESFVWVSLESGKPFLRVHQAPWMDARASFVTFKAAHAALCDPEQIS